MDGLIIVNKEKEISSFGVVAKVRKIFNTKKVGHTGTLDPNATGVLPILIGKGTKMSQYLMEHDKKYEAVLFLGKATSTGDEEGEIIDEKDVDQELLASKEKITEILESFLGKTVQKPPIYSAIKKNGKKLYEYARQGLSVEIPEREIQIYEIELKQIDTHASTIRFIVKCSKGTYIRVLCEDIAKKMGTCGYMKELNRLEVDKFSIENAKTLEEIEKEYKENKTEQFLITIEELAQLYDKIFLTQKQKIQFLNGVKLSFSLEDGLYSIYDENGFLGLGIINKSFLKRELVLE